MKQRLFALDLLRGVNIFWLTVVVELVLAYGAWRGLPEALLAQFDHPRWIGFTVHDVIMPLFIFMSGAALPLALPRRLRPDGSAGWAYWRHVLARVGLLWFLGLVCQGELLSFDLERISFFNNTLQTIACAYLAVAVALRLPRAVRFSLPLVLSAGYFLFLHTVGELTPDGNAAVVWETKFLLLFYPDAARHPVSQIVGWGYSWWTTVPMFAVMGLCGAGATGLLCRERCPPVRRAALLAGAGLGLLALGGLLALVDPVVKRIFTISFTALAMGVCCLLYAFAYALGDILGWRRGTGLFILFGRHSLWAYMAGEFFRGLLVYACLFLLCGPAVRSGGGLSRFFDEDAFRFVLAVATAAALVASVWMRDRWTRRASSGNRATAMPGKENKDDR